MLKSACYILQLEDHKEVNDTTREKLEDIYLNCCSGDERNKTLKEENDLIKQQLRVRKLSVSVYNLKLCIFLFNNPIKSKFTFFY